MSLEDYYFKLPDFIKFNPKILKLSYDVTDRINRVTGVSSQDYLLKLSSEDAEIKELRNKFRILYVELLIFIDNVCNKHGIDYWLGFGTLLGAIRHGGFIPWDDDIDILMPRPDYERFISSYRSSAGYKIISEGKYPVKPALFFKKDDPTMKEIINISYVKYDNNTPIRFYVMAKEGETAVEWLKGQNLGEYKIIHLQGVMGSAAQQGRSGALDAAVASDGWTLVTQQTAEWNAEKAQQIVQSVIDSGKSFNVIYAENDDMAKGAVAALDKANISHGVGKDVIIMGFDCNKWALEELKAGNWNYDGQCNPFQSSYITEIIQKLEAGETLSQKTIIMDEKGFDASTITQEDVDKYGI